MTHKVALPFIWALCFTNSQTQLNKGVCVMPQTPERRQRYATLSVEVPRKMMEQLATIAAQRKMKRSQYVRLLINKAIEEAR